ncbi:MAG: MopE-related protein [Gammaproteobacteria bacterium]|nr:MopE-related protein [Gammaproteobacteria bacterium]
MAQTAKVYVANSSNSRIQLVQFDPPSTTAVNDDANLLTQVRDIAIRDDGLDGVNLIACDRNGGRVVFYPNASGIGQVVFDEGNVTGPGRPDGVSLDLFGNLFVMDSGQGNSSGLSEVWVVMRDSGCPDPMRPECLNGGYRAPLGLIDAHVQIATEIGGNATLIDADLLPESSVSASTAGLLHTGDLLVLANPGALLRYAAADIAAFLSALTSGVSPSELTPDTIIHPADASVPAAQRFPDGLVPNGMAFAPNGDLLIPVSDGRILIYGPDGHRRSDGMGGFTDFVASSGQDEFKIAVGLQGGKYRAFVTHQQRGELRRYTINSGGTGTLDTVVDGFQFPVGVDTTTSNTVHVPSGSNVPVSQTSIIDTVIEEVVAGGDLNASVHLFPDPREDEQMISPEQPLHRSLFLNELRADFPPIEIPAWVRAFRVGDPVTGTPSFIVEIKEADIAVAGVMDHLTHESILLGYDPDCVDPDITQQPFLFWSPDDNDPPIFEGATFIDVTTGCGTIRGLTRDLSFFLAGVRITLPFSQVVADKLTALQQIITGEPCIAPLLRQGLAEAIDRAIDEFGLARLAELTDALQDIDDLVEQSPESFSSCTVNVGGELQARARSTIFAVTKLTSCFVDGDGDGFGSADRVLSEDEDCNDAGESNVGTDCDDADPNVNPGNNETTCNGIDDDCDPATTDAPGGTTDDCNANGLADECDLAAGAADCDSNGILDECEATPPNPAASPHDVLKNRWLSFAPELRCQQVAYQITLPDGRVGWVGEPVLRNWQGDDSAWLALVVDAPVYREWSGEDAVHVYGCVIVPDEVYEIRATTDAVAFTDSLLVATVPAPIAGAWADIVGVFDDGPMTWHAPNGFVNFDDIDAAVKKFQVNPTAPHVTVVDLHPQWPNYFVNFSDVDMVIKGFQGVAYPVPVTDCQTVANCPLGGEAPCLP